MPSLRWIHENLISPFCDEESSDIADSCSDDNSSDVENFRIFHHYDEFSRNSKSRPCSNLESPKLDYSSQHYPGIPKTDSISSYSTVRSVDWDPRRTWIPIEFQAMIKLYSRNGHYLGMSGRGRVVGVPAERHNDSSVILSVTSSAYRVLQIQSCETGLYLAFNSTGHLYAELNGKKDNTIWERWSIGDYDLFRSQKYADLDWWLGIKRNGRPKSGPRTSWGQAAIEFLTTQMA